MKSENKIQQESTIWLWNTYPLTRRLCYHIPNGGLRTARESAMLKAIGVLPGIPDIHLAIPAQGYASLYVEFKTESGRLSADQETQRSVLRAAGNAWYLCRSLEEFKDIIHYYLEETSYLAT